MVILTPDQQAVLVREHADAFSPESGAWGRQGCTRVTLKAVDEDILGEAMTMAWQNGVAKNASKTRGKRPLRKKKRSA